MRQQDLVGTLVRVWTSSGEARIIVGTGFLVSPRFVLTCAHVVADALELDAPQTFEAPQQPLLIDFPATRPGHLYQTSVVIWHPRVQQPGGVYDIAVLELDVDAPGIVARFAPLEEPWGLPCRIFGFPAGHPDGSYASGTLQDVLANGWVMIRGGNDAREFVRRGYSGGPVYTEDGVVGMLTEGDASQRVREAAMIPISALLGAWPELYTVNTPCPYQGLASFDENSARFFFGRDETTARLVEALTTTTQPTVLAGGSGSGKSSLVAAGLLPTLRQAGWEVCTFHPGSTPFTALAYALLRIWQPELSGADLLLEQERLADSLRSGELKVGDVMTSALGIRSADTKLLISVDQFEELFTLNRGAATDTLSPDVETFLEQLISAQAEPESQGRIKVLFTVRTDFLDRLLASPQTATWHQETGFVHYLGRVTELEHVMEGPLKETGLGQFEGGLVERIKADLASEGTGLPLLEFTLTELWRHHSAGRLTHRAYDRLGGVGRTLANYAQTVYDNLSSAEQEQAKRLFLQLMQPDSEGRATRRVAHLSELDEAMRPLVSLLADKRLIVTGQSPEEPNGVEVIHEALFEHWPLLHSWVEEGWMFRRWQETLRSTIRDWSDSGEIEEYLIQGARLTVAQEYQSTHARLLTQGEVQFIRASSDIQRRQRQDAQARLQRNAARQRRTSQILASALSVTLLFSAAAAWQWSRARHEASRAETFNGQLQQTNIQLKKTTTDAQNNARRALASTLGAQGLLATDTPGASNGDPRLGALLAVQAVGTENSLKTRSNLLRVIERAPLPDSRGIPAIEANPNGSSLLISTTPGTEVWTTGTRTKRFDLPVGGIPDDVAFNPKGTLLATAFSASGVQLWDAHTGRALGNPLPYSGVTVVKLVFAPDGKRLLVCSMDGQLELWDVRSREIVGRLTRPAEVSPPGPPATSLPFRSPVTVLPSVEHVNWLSSLAFDPTGRTLAVAGAAGEVLLYSGFDLRFRRNLATETIVRSLAFSPDGNRLALGDRSGGVAVWSVVTGTRLGDPLGALPSIPQSLAFSASGNHLAAGDAEGNLLMWNLRTREPYRNSSSFSSEAISRVLFDHETLIVEGTEGLRAALWRMSPVRNLLHLDADLRATFNADSTMGLWSVDRDELRSPLGDTPDSLLVQSIFSPSGERFATRSNERQVQLWDADTSLPVGPPIADQTDIESIAFSADSRLFVTGDREGRVILRNGLTGQAIRGPLKLSIPRALSIAFQPGGKRMAVATEGDVVVWDMVRSKVVGRPEWDIPAIERMDLVQVVTFSPDGKWLLGGYERYVYIWRAETLELVEVLPGMAEDRKVRDIVFRPDGEQFMVSYNDGWSAATWRAPNWDHVANLIGITSLAYSLDERFLVVGGSGTVTFHDPMTLETIGDPIDVHETAVTTVAFSPDGNSLVSGDTSNLNHRWNTTFSAWREAACDRAGRNFSAAEWSQHLGSAPYKKTCASYSVDAAAVDLLLEQALVHAAEKRGARAEILFTRAITYAAEIGDINHLRSVCEAAGIHLDQEAVLCGTDKTAQVK